MDIKSQLRELIPNSQYGSGKKELIMRCPYCGHTSSPGKKHLYINISEDKPYMFNCFKCEEHGLVNKEFLSYIGITDISLISAIEAHNKSLLKNTSGFYYGKKNTSVRVPYKDFEIDEKIYRDKVDYISTRLGCEFPLWYLRELKIIFDFTFFKSQIKGFLRCSDSDFGLIQKDYVGFLSINNTALILRCIRQCDRKFRYIIVKLSDNNFSKIYSIPSQISIYNLKPRVFITEGQFDILSVFSNMNMGYTGAIYLAASGNKYQAAIEQVLSKGILSMELHLYFDNDNAGNIAMNQMRYFIMNNRDIFSTSEVYSHVNQLSKDFGVPLNEIKDKVTRLF